MESPLPDLGASQLLDIDRQAFHATSLLDLLERTWAYRLRGVSLTTEIDADEVMVKAAADGLGQVYRRLKDGRHQEIAERWPGCVAVAVAGIAAATYRSGSFWPRWWAAAHYRGRARDNTAIGEAFLASLRRLGLADFPELARKQRYVGPIMMHAGIPTSCLAGFFRFILTRNTRDLASRQSEGPEGSEDLEGSDGLGGLDEPVRQFLLHGGDHASDLTERCLDLLERLRSPDPDLDGLRLPVRITEHARELVRDGLLDLAPHRSGEFPRLALAPFGTGIHLTLPAAEEPRRVEVDGIMTELPSHVTRFAIPGPARTARVEPYGTVLHLVNPADPLLVFAEDGRHLPSPQPLPSDVVWVAHPKAHRLTSDAPLRVVAESLLPIGWPGWRLAQISLAGVSRLALDDGPRRLVRGPRKPRVLTREPLAGVTTSDGSPVLATPPSVWLPGGEVTWSVDVRRSGSAGFGRKTGDGMVFSGSFTTVEPTEIAGLWDRATRPIVGTFTITVRGPIGMGTRRTIVVAEGLDVRCDPPVRLCDDNGLVPSSARITAPGMTRMLDFSPTETSHAFTWGLESFVLTPPHMRVTADDREWSAGPLRLSIEALGAAESLRIDVPGAGFHPRLDVVAGGRTVQELAPSAHGHYNLRRLLDTVTAHFGADLMLTLDGRRVPVAVVRPAGLASGVEHRGDRLALADMVWAEGLIAGIYPADGRPEVVPVARDGTIPLPEHLAGAGRLRVRLVVPDPWLPHDWTAPPSPQETFVCENPRSVESPKPTPG